MVPLPQHCSFLAPRLLHYACGQVHCYARFIHYKKRFFSGIQNHCSIHDDQPVHNPLKEYNLPGGVVAGKKCSTGSFSVFLINHFLYWKFYTQIRAGSFSETFLNFLKQIFNYINIIIPYQRTSRSVSISCCPTFLEFIKPTLQEVCKGCWRSIFSRAPTLNSSYRF